MAASTDTLHTHSEAPVNVVIEASGVGKTFQQRTPSQGGWASLWNVIAAKSVEVPAVSDVSFKISEGEAVGYLGPNGAGKSTMIKMMTGILVPSSGTVSVLGRDPHQNRVRNAKQIGVVFGQRSQLWWDLPVVETFELHKRLYEISDQTYKRNIEYFMRDLGLADLLDRPVRQLSLGQRMRAEISLALLHDPKILFLDEPTIGLDVGAKDALRAFLRAANRSREVTIILTTHDLQDVEAVCGRLMVVDRARLVFDGDLERLRLAAGAYRRLTIDLFDAQAAVDIRSARLVVDDPQRKTYVIEDDSVSMKQMVDLVSAAYRVRDLSVAQPDIDDIVRLFYSSRVNV